MLEYIIGKNGTRIGGITFIKIKEKPIPFFVDVPDENLVSLIEDNKNVKGKALDIGCGNGRNTHLFR